MKAEIRNRPSFANVLVQLQPTANPAVSQPFPLGAGRDSFGLGFQVTGAHNDALTRSPGRISANSRLWIFAKGVF